MNEKSSLLEVRSQLIKYLQEAQKLKGVGGGAEGNYIYCLGKEIGLLSAIAEINKALARL